ncbi:MAG: manganese efflux pump MntP family protein [Eggerthellaceae bacterium]|nr:manganese efflux pump MntP family protein [Eggerthellaceae bacterium]
MGFVELLVIAVGLSMDAFAVSVGKGLCMRQVRWGQALAIALCFGLFQAAMPLVGWALGTQFSQYVEPVDHWVAFGLLGVIGAKMVWDGLHEQPDDACPADEQALPVAELLMLGVATSIDAFAVGCTFAFLSVDIVVAVAVIGVVTFVLSLVGVALGHQVGSRYNKAATIAGGVVLVLIGLKTLLEHLGIIA